MSDGKRKRRKRRRCNPEEAALRHPLRVKILALYEEDENRSLAACDLLPNLPDDPSPEAIAYHIKILQSAKLLP